MYGSDWKMGDNNPVRNVLMIIVAVLAIGTAILVTKYDLGVHSKRVANPQIGTGATYIAPANQ